MSSLWFCGKESACLSRIPFFAYGQGVSWVCLCPPSAFQISPQTAIAGNGSDCRSGRAQRNRSRLPTVKKRTTHGHLGRSDEGAEPAILVLEARRWRHGRGGAESIPPFHLSLERPAYFHQRLSTQTDESPSATRFLLQATHLPALDGAAQRLEAPPPPVCATSLIASGGEAVPEPALGCPAGAAAVAGIVAHRKRAACRPVHCSPAESVFLINLIF